MTVTRLSGGLTPADGADPRTFPAIWNVTADTIEAQGSAVLPSGGSAGQVLVKDSGTDYDADWVGLPLTVDPRTVFSNSGWTRNYTSNFGTSTTRTISLNLDFRMFPYPFFAKQSFTHIGCQVTATTANAGAVARLGIFKALPGNLRHFDVVLDGGTVAIDSTGVKEITVSSTLDSGVYWFGLMIEDLTSGGATFSAISGANPFMPAALNSNSVTRGAGTIGATQASVGPWPSPITTAPFGTGDTVPYVFLRYSL